MEVTRRDVEVAVLVGLATFALLLGAAWRLLVRPLWPRDLVRLTGEAPDRSPPRPRTR